MTFRQILIIFIYIASAAAIQYTFYQMCDRNVSLPRWLLRWGIGCLIIVLYYRFIFLTRIVPTVVFVPVISVLICSLIFLVSSRGAIWKRIFLCVTYDDLFCIYTGTTEFIGKRLLPGREQDVLYFLAVLAILFLFHLYLNNSFFPAIKSAEAVPASEWKRLTAVPMTAAVIIILLVYIIRVFEYGSVLEIIAAWLIFFLIFFSMLLMMHLASSIEAAGRAREMELQNRVYNTAILARDANEQEIRRIRHDQRHHNRTIAEFAAAGDTEGILKYLQTAVHETTDIQKNYCANPVLNNIIRAYVHMAREQQIEINVSSETKIDIPVDTSDMIAIVANILENAIHGAYPEDGVKKIDLNLTNPDERLVIHLSNTCDPKLRLYNGYPTEKKGTGILSIINSVQKYSGLLQYKIENQRLHTTVILMLNIPKKQLTN